VFCIVRHCQSYWFSVKSRNNHGVRYIRVNSDLVFVVHWYLQAQTS
jgi:hypothetical protein